MRNHWKTNDFFTSSLGNRTIIKRNKWRNNKNHTHIHRGGGRGKIIKKPMEKQEKSHPHPQGRGGTTIPLGRGGGGFAGPWCKVWPGLGPATPSPSLPMVSGSYIHVCADTCIFVILKIPCLLLMDIYDWVIVAQCLQPWTKARVFDLQREFRGKRCYVKIFGIFRDARHICTSPQLVRIGHLDDQMSFSNLHRLRAI